MSIYLLPRPIASQLQAEAGVDTSNMMTPERTAQAIAAMAGGPTSPTIAPMLPEIAFAADQDTQVIDLEAMGSTITDRGCFFGENLRLFLPGLEGAVASGMSIAIRSTRVGQGEHFGIYPHYNDITGYWGRVFQVGNALAQFSLYALDGGQMCVLTPREVNQHQLHFEEKSGADFEVGQTISGDDSGAVATIVFIDVVNRVLQVAEYSGSFTYYETMTASGGGTARLVRNVVPCQYMWEVNFIQGSFCDLDDGWYQSWY